MVHLLLAIIYLSFISLGLPDSMLGAAWPNMYNNFAVPLSYAGIISAIIASGTIISSLQSDRLTLKLGTGLVTAISVALTAVALLGFSLADEFLQLCLWAIPYGLGGGSVDAALNNYVALNYKSRHMSWLHCMWGVGAATGPYVMAYALTSGLTWHGGYRYIFFVQIVLSSILFVSLPLWQKKSSQNNAEQNVAVQNANVQKRKALSLKDVLGIKGARSIFVCFFCYCAIEQTAGLWASSYLSIFKGFSAEKAAQFASLFYIGITAGRALSGFLTMIFSDVKMIRLGQEIILLGIVLMILPASTYFAVIGLILIGLGCAPIYPCIIHSTPAHFGADKSQAVIGVQMAFAYTGTLAMPPLFGIIAGALNVALLPLYLCILLLLMIILHEVLVKVTKAHG